VSVAGFASHGAVGWQGGAAVDVTLGVVGFASVGRGVASGFGAVAVADDEGGAEWAGECSGGAAQLEVEFRGLEGEEAECAVDDAEEGC
jgi:hypothetical protein